MLIANIDTSKLLLRKILQFLLTFDEGFFGWQFFPKSRKKIRIEYFWSLERKSAIMFLKIINRGGLLKPPPCPIRVKDSPDIQISIFWPFDYFIKSHKNCLVAIMADIIWERPLMACARYLKYANS